MKAENTALLAKALKVKLSSSIVETSFSKANQFPLETKTSFQRDVETKGRQSEWDLFGGTIIRYAGKFNIPADNTKTTLEKLLRDLQLITSPSLNFNNKKFITELRQPTQKAARLVSSGILL